MRTLLVDVETSPNTAHVSIDKDCLDCYTPLTRENMHPSLLKSQSYICKKCSTARSTRWRKSNPDKLKVNDRKNKLKCKYGLSVEQYNEILSMQEGVCALCLKEHKRRPLNVDHCHSTGRIRGLLCDKCNLAIGLLGDNADLALRAARYLS